MQRGTGPDRRHPAGTGPALEEPGAARGQLDLRLGAALHPAHRGAALPLQLQCPVPDVERRRPVRSGLLLLRRVEARHRHGHRRHRPQPKIGIGALPAGFPPLAFVGSDQKTLTGSEPDLGRLVAAVLGLSPEVRNSTWENLFVGIDGGKVDVAFSNVTDTEERKKKYEFASYRQDNLAFLVRKKSTWNFDGDYETLAGKTVAVGSGTNQEKILLEWKAKLAKEGKKLTVKYFQDSPSTYLALNSGRIDASFGPNPGFAYHNRQTAGTPNATRTAGTYSGAGASLQGLIAATAKKDSGLAKPLADAINYLIEHGQYAQWLKAYDLSDEAVAKSEVNPPGLPLDNS
ncbi:transporter substrate-binding domain-containing protein [Streptomyces sp. NPDC048386]|uniref:transporter substrate-binding domain-containing protein n=1 Tax=Streptomyces sp. NPDC048386 TaxID=3365541 RepID=UPI00371707D2